MKVPKPASVLYPKFYPIDVLTTTGQLWFLSTVLNTGYNGDSATGANINNGESALVSQVTVYCKYEKITREAYQALAIRYAQIRNNN